MEHDAEAGLAREAAWERAECQALLVELQGLRRAMADCEWRLASWIRQAHPSQAASARNLSHYLAMRSVDARGLQDRLARLGKPTVAPYTCTVVRRHGPYLQLGGIETTVWCKGSYIRTCDRLECMTDLQPDRLWPTLAQILSTWASTSRSA